MQEHLNLERSPNDTGWMLNLYVYLNDRGQLYINGAPINTRQKANWVAAARNMLQHLEQLQHKERDLQEPAPFMELNEDRVTFNIPMAD